jgi:hypothetical protein
MRSRAEVLDHHLKCFASRDRDAVSADYSADAVFFGPKTHPKHKWWDLVRSLYQRTPARKYPGGGSYRRGSIYGETPKCCSPMIDEGFQYAI